MFERFTSGSRRAVVIAQQEAHDAGSPHIGTEHLLIALARVDEVAAAALKEVGVTEDGLRGVVNPGYMVSNDKNHLSFTPRIKRVFELALREALDRRRSYIGTEHLLLGIIREGNGRAVEILAGMAVDPALLLVGVGGMEKDESITLAYAPAEAKADTIVKTPSKYDPSNEQWNEFYEAVCVLDDACNRVHRLSPGVSAPSHTNELMRFAELARRASVLAELIVETDGDAILIDT
jgi:ATP-dependent Clp protease ATP-binding subunit ClpA